MENGTAGSAYIFCEDCTLPGAITDICIDPSQSGTTAVDIVYVVGYTGDDIDGFHNSANSLANTATDAFIARFDIGSTASSLGSNPPKWIVQFGEPNAASDRALACTVGSTGDVFVTGAQDAKGGNLEDVFVVKFSKTDINTNIAANGGKNSAVVWKEIQVAIDNQETPPADPIMGTYSSRAILTTYNTARDDVPEKMAISSDGLFITGTRKSASGDTDLFLFGLALDLSQKWLWSDSASTIWSALDEKPTGIILSSSDVLVVGNRNAVFTSDGALSSGSTFLAKFSSSGALTWSFINAPTDTYISGEAVDAVTAMSGPMPTSAGFFYTAGYSLRTAGSDSYDRIIVQNFGSDLTSAPTRLWPSYTKLTKTALSTPDEALPYPAYMSTLFENDGYSPYRAVVKSVLTVPNRNLIPFGGDTIFIAGSVRFKKVASSYYYPFILKLVTPPRE